jgi:hypothetical protein
LIVVVGSLAAVVPVGIHVGLRARDLARTAANLQREIQPTIDEITAGADRASAHAERISQRPVLAGQATARTRDGRR